MKKNNGLKKSPLIFFNPYQKKKRKSFDFVSDKNFHLEKKSGKKYFYPCRTKIFQRFQKSHLENPTTSANRLKMQKNKKYFFVLAHNLDLLCSASRGHSYTRSVTPRRKTLRKLEFLLHFSDSDPSRVFYEMRRVWNLLISENTIKSKALAAKASVEIPADTSNPRILQSSTKRHTIFRLFTGLKNPFPSLNRFFEFLFWGHIMRRQIKLRY